MEQRVLLCMLDTIDWPTAFLGCIKAGVVPVAVNTLLIPTDDEFMLRDSLARALIVAAGLLPKFTSALASSRCVQHVIVAGERVDAYRSFSDLLAEGGTVHVHSSLVRTAELYGRPAMGIRESDVIFSAAKLLFAYGLGNASSFPLSVGATTVLMADRATPDATFARLLKA